MRFIAGEVIEVVAKFPQCGNGEIMQSIDNKGLLFETRIVENLLT